MQLFTPTNMTDMYIAPMTIVRSVAFSLAQEKFSKYYVGSSLNSAEYSLETRGEIEFF